MVPGTSIYLVRYPVPIPTGGKYRYRYKNKIKIPESIIYFFPEPEPINFCFQSRSRFFFLEPEPIDFFFRCRSRLKFNQLWNIGYQYLYGTGTGTYRYLPLFIKGSTGINVVQYITGNGTSVFSLQYTPPRPLPDSYAKVISDPGY